MPNVVFVALPVTLFHFFENSHLFKGLESPSPSAGSSFVFCGNDGKDENPRG